MMGEIGEIGKYVAHASLKWHSRPTLSLLFHQRGTSQSESVGWSDRPRLVGDVHVKTNAAASSSQP